MAHAVDPQKPMVASDTQKDVARLVATKPTTRTVDLEWSNPL
jgi:hypothetical protein